MAGESILVVFDSAAAAVRCALQVQQRQAKQATPETGTLRLSLRIGIHAGDVLEMADGSVYGEGVDVAAFLRSIVQPGGVFVSNSIRDLVGGKQVARFEDAGEHQFTNVPRPLRAWCALPVGAATGEEQTPPLASLTSISALHFGGRFELQPMERRLLIDGVPVALGGRAFDLLCVLAEAPGVLHPKNQLLDRVWPGLVVEENNLFAQISALRKVLGSEVVATITGRGYRFVPQVKAIAATEPGNRTLAASSLPSQSGQASSPNAAASPVAAPTRTNLPSTLNLLFGRSEDLSALDVLLSRHRVVSIVGAGGMGKTAVALQHTFSAQAAGRHRVCWVELETATSDADLPAAIATAVGVDLGSGDPLAGLCAALAPLTMLITLDNAEHVVEGLARVLHALLAHAPGLRFLVTSQAPLKLMGERVYRIGALAVPTKPLPAEQALEFGAVALFTERAQAADVRFTLSDSNAPAVIDLCRHLDGLALAIELAAARAPMLGVQRLATSMGARLQVLTRSGNRMAPARQQTLRAAMEWSHSFLDARERAVFRRLSVFAGSASLAMAQQVLSEPPNGADSQELLDEWGVLDALSLLVDRSLVSAITAGEGAEPRYRLLDTPRLFAREKLQEAGESAVLRQRHSWAVAEFFEEAEARVSNGLISTEGCMQATTADLANGREALTWASESDNAALVVQLATTITRALPRGVNREKSALVDTVEPLIDRIESAELLARLCPLIVGSISGTQPERTARLIRRCVARMPPLSGAGTASTRWAHHLALGALAVAESLAGDLAAAEVALGQARSLVDPSWPRIRARWHLEAEMQVSHARGDMETALHWTQRIVAMEESPGPQAGGYLANLILAELAAGNPKRAAATGAAAIVALAGRRDENDLACARLYLAAALLALNEPENARPHLRAGWEQAPLFDLQSRFADSLALLAAVEGRFSTAARLLGFSSTHSARFGEQRSSEVADGARATKLARTALGDLKFGRLHDEGCALRDSDIEMLAFGAGDAS